MPKRHLTQLGLSVSTPPPSRGSDQNDGRGYPRPQLRRKAWHSLNGSWEFAIDPEGTWCTPSEVSWRSTIIVPFAPETSASGIGDTSLFRACWYRRTFETPSETEGNRLILHFGAVDYDATVWLDGIPIGRHEGGYTPFSFDITDAVTGGGTHEITLRAVDDPTDLTKPRGKQDWRLEPHSIWYPRTTGIWQTVWLEIVPAARVEHLRWTPNLERWEIELEAAIIAPPGQRVRLGVTLRVGELVLAQDHYTVVAGEVHRRIALSDPGIDDFRNELLWSPNTPTLIDADIELLDARTNEKLDQVISYTALRSFDLQGDRFVLNGLPFPLRLVLDQGYWEATGLTSPDDDAQRKDVELAKAMGFNGVRKHQKIEDPRYLYWADKLGLLVWEEMPSAYRFTGRSVDRLIRQWLEVLRRDVSHPCIIAWVPFNESWGVPNLPASQSERHYVQALYHATKTVDPTRPVIGNDGWESVATDVIGIHDYDDKPERIARRYFAHEALPRLLKRERPGGRALVLDGHVGSDLPVVLSEFGGISLRETGTWGYSTCATPDELAKRYTALLESVRSLDVLAGFCYTQFADTYQEANGLLYADRRPKFPLSEIAFATTGRAPVASAAPLLEPPSCDVAATKFVDAPK